MFWEEVAMPTNDPAAETHPRSRLRKIWLIPIAILIVIVSVGGWMAYSGISISLQAERNLHDTLFAIQVVEQFVHDKGHWPRSWEELEQLPFPSKTPSPLNVDRGYDEDWPARSKIVWERVFIDFQAEPEQIARQDPMKFVAIKPIGPFYEYRDYEAVPSLQKTLQKAIGDRKQAQVTNLTNANLSSAMLANANLTGATVTGANFSYSNPVASQLYSTASYEAYNLSNIKLFSND